MNFIINVPKLVFSIDISPDSQQIICGLSGNILRIYDCHTGLQVGVDLKGHHDVARAVKYSHDGQRIASGSNDYTIRIWNPKTQQQIRQPLIGHDHQVLSVAFSPTESHVASGSFDNTVRIWCLRDRRQIALMKGHRGYVDIVSYSNDGKYIQSQSGIDLQLKIWNCRTHTLVRTLEGYQRFAATIHYCFISNCIIAPHRLKSLGVRNQKTKKLVRCLNGHTDFVRAIAISTSERMALAGCQNGEVLAWDISTGNQIGPKVQHVERISQVRFSKNEKSLMSLGDFGNVMVSQLDL